jgi:hypothetical protein
MATLSYLVSEIDRVLDDPAYTEMDLVSKINNAVTNISAGILLPDGSISPPLPDLYTTGSVSTSTTNPYVSLPVDYQRSVIMIYDSTGIKINPPIGGNYYSYSLFLRQITDLSLAESGSVTKLAIKGSRLYYQGIPTVAETLGLHYYKKPTDMVADDDEPEGIPSHLHERLIVHYVLKEIMGSKIEDGQDNTGIGTKYHTGKFNEAMIELVQFIGIDEGPMYYGSNDFEDLGVCD